MLCALSRCEPEPSPERMQAYVYKSLRKADTYVYLGARDDFARLPDPLRTQLGNLQFVLELASIIPLSFASSSSSSFGSTIPP